MLKEGLLSRRIAPGSRLNVDRIARELYVSNTPVRQAMARLESEGLVTRDPRRGFAAAQLLDARLIAEFYAYRLLIEPLTAARAAAIRCEADLARLDSLCHPAEIQRRLSDLSFKTEIGQRDAAFHCAIARQAGNSVIEENLATVLIRMRPYGLYGLSGAGQLAWNEHQAIATAIRDANPARAAAAMRTHLTNGLKRIMEACR